MRAARGGELRTSVLRSHCCCCDFTSVHQYWWNECPWTLRAKLHVRHWFTGKRFGKRAWRAGGLMSAAFSPLTGAYRAVQCAGTCHQRGAHLPGEQTDHENTRDREANSRGTSRCCVPPNSWTGERAGTVKQGRPHLAGGWLTCQAGRGCWANSWQNPQLLYWNHKCVFSHQPHL